MLHIKLIQHKTLAATPFALVLFGLFFVLYKLSVLSLFWNDPATVQRWMGHFLGLNLQGMASWQSTAARMVDFQLWFLMVQGWWFGAKAARAWHQNDGLNETVVEQINRCAVYISAAWTLTLLVRPFRNLLVQWHLPLHQWVFKWQYAMGDAVTLMVCLCLIMMAMLCKKWQSTDQENRAFI